MDEWEPAMLTALLAHADGMSVAEDTQEKRDYWRGARDMLQAVLNGPNHPRIRMAVEEERLRRAIFGDDDA